jgi:hypothetical protein
MAGSVAAVAQRMMALATQNVADPVVAYLCAWTAAQTLITSWSWQEGVRPQFSLRRNGTLRTHKVGDLKMPDVIPPRADHQLRAALKHLAPDAQDRLIVHPAVLDLARRVPTLNGKPLLKDAFGQRITGVLDLAMTRDPRYPVWCTVDVRAVKKYLAGQRTGKATESLVRQITVVLRTVHSNLLMDDSDADEVVAQKVLPLVGILVAGWLEQDGDPRPDSAIR